MVLSLALAVRAVTNASVNITQAPNASQQGFDALPRSDASGAPVHECEASLLQMLSGAAGPCGAEKFRALALLVCLCATLVGMLCAFAFFREDKEEQITPLCPQLVVREHDLVFKMPFDQQVDQMTVNNLKNELLGKVIMDWPDVFRPGSCGVAATARLQNNLDLTLATVVARNVSGPGIALCRAGCEIFGFVEAESTRRYNVRHRTGVHLLTLQGDFQDVDVEGINPVGSKVCWFKKVGLECRGRVLQHVDAGLIICSLMAVHLHRRLLAGAASPRSVNPGRPGAASDPFRPGKELQDGQVDKESPSNEAPAARPPMPEEAERGLS